MPTLLTAGFVFLAASGAYLLLFVGPNLLYIANVFLHFGVGLLVILPFAFWAIRRFRADTADLPRRAVSRVGIVVMAAGIAAGIALAIVGGLRAHRWLADVHMILAAVGVVLLACDVARPRRSAPASPGLARRLAGRAVLPVCVLLLVGGFWAARAASRPTGLGVENPDDPPSRMEDEAMGGKEGPFFPSSAATSTGGLIPSGFFVESERACARCHRDIYAQWFSSAHHFSSFNNRWYARSIEYMQEVTGIQPSKWCAGCHDVALLFTGLMDRPVEEVARTPEGQAGLGCVACHAIGRVKSTMGQGDYVIEYRWLQRLASSESRLVRAAHDFFVHLNPELHRRTFLKPFHRSEGANGAEFCVACHKVHLDVPVNEYRWLRGFNDYDAWQASGVSGQGARSFYYPPAAKSCGECHMPLVLSADRGNRSGFVHSHRFPGANTALPTADQDGEQLATVVRFLEGAVSVDIFAVSRDGGRNAGPAQASGRAAPAAARLSTTFGVGEESGEGPGRLAAPLRAVHAPIDGGGVAVRRGESVLIEVVVRNRRTGHFFPGGTVDAFDVWAELKATDAAGRVILWSGAVEDEGRGPVEPGAHFYRSYLLDAHGNTINKRNAWAARSLLYSRLVPPGAADTVHYRLDVPADVQGPITLEARVNYRKFSWWYTQFSFRGRREPSAAPPAVTRHYDNGRFIFDTARAAPDLPIVVVGRAHTRLDVVDARAPLLGQPPAAPSAGLRERWNDYGIGLFLQGDLRNAEQAFLKVTELDPGYADGWVNVARVRLEEGDAAGALGVLEKARALDGTLAKIQHFLGLALKAHGRYDEALTAFRRAAAVYPRDRVVRNEIGKLLYLVRRFDDSIAEFRAVLKIDPEDVTAHYGLMLSHRALGDAERAEQARRLYLRFKADENAPVITGEVRRTDAWANNEAQPVHEHRAALPGARR